MKDFGWRSLKSQKGVSLVEVMVAATIVSITFYSLLSIFTNYQKVLGKIGQGKSEMLSVANYRESILSDPANFQTVANEFEGEARLQASNLPWYISQNSIVTKEECIRSSNCDRYQTRMGYVIFPHESGITRSLYTLKIRVFDSVNNVTKDFRYLVTPK